MQEIDNKVIIYEDTNGEISLDVSLENDTVWLSQKQLEILFDRDQSGISRHLNKIFKSNELEKESNMQKMHIANSDKPVSFYNLDVIISLGYRVNSKRATNFRIWATKILKEYLINGYSLNKNRLQQKGLDEFNQTISLLKDTISHSHIEFPEAKGLLDVILMYSRTWSLLQAYDEDSLETNIEIKEEEFILDFDEAKQAIEKIKKELIGKGEASELFGKDKELKINDNALVALSLMTAKSDPQQKDTIIKLIVNILGE